MLIPSAFPPDAVAVINRPSRSVMMSGKARARDWKLRFERRSAPYIEPLMGWTGGDDTLAQVELSFPSVEAAISYARRQNLAVALPGLEKATMSRRRQHLDPSRRGANDRAARSPLPQWVEQALGQGATGGAIDRALLDPASCFADPEGVLRDPKLSREMKREILRRWALDAYLTEMAATEGVPKGEPSRLQEVIDALIDLDDAGTLAAIANRARVHPGNVEEKAAA
jgi:hypothetical protein